MSTTVTLEQLLSNTKKSGKCRIWRGYVRTDNGAPMFTLRRKKVYAHRLVYELTHPDEDIHGKSVVHVHECKSRACLEPTHLVAVESGEAALYRKAHGWMMS